MATKGTLGMMRTGCMAAMIVAAMQPIGVCAQTAPEAPEALCIEVNMATTKHGAVIPVSGGYRLELQGDTVRSFLPYYGRAYMAPMAMGNAMHFTSVADSVACESLPNGTRRLSFATRTMADLMRFSVTIYPDGRATIGVRPQQRDRITYDGYVER